MAPVKAKLPPAYHNLSVMLLGRLAVGNAFKGQGLGAALLFDALKRSGKMVLFMDTIWSKVGICIFN